MTFWWGEIHGEFQKLELGYIKRGEPIPRGYLERHFCPHVQPDLEAQYRRFTARRIDEAGKARVDLTICAYRLDDGTIGMSWLEVSAIQPPAPAIAFVAPFISQARWPGTYWEYLATPQWQKIAAAARREWGNKCLMNVDHRGPLEMHHRNYRGVPFHEDWQDLIPLCEECHALYHHRLLKPPRGLFDEPCELTRAA